MIKHPEVASCIQSCPSCPEQYEGRLIDGRWFYFRYRHGRANLGIGHSFESAVRSSDLATLRTGDDLQGAFYDDSERNSVFAELLKSIKEKT